VGWVASVTCEQRALEGGEGQTIGRKTASRRFSRSQQAVNQQQSISSRGQSACGQSANQTIRQTISRQVGCLTYRLGRHAAKVLSAMPVPHDMCTVQHRREGHRNGHLAGTITARWQTPAGSIAAKWHTRAASLARAPMRTSESNKSTIKYEAAKKRRRCSQQNANHTITHRNGSQRRPDPPSGGKKNDTREKSGAKCDYRGRKAK
jgi:hypothetical protein